MNKLNQLKIIAIFMSELFEYFGKCTKSPIIFLLISNTFVYAQTVNVSSFGSDDSNNSIQLAMNSSNDTIIIDSSSNPWLVAPMRFQGLVGKTIIFEEGVDLRAKPGAFPNDNDALLVFTDCSDITIIGNDSEICMNKKEYVTGEWRHGISLKGSKNIKIKDLTIRGTGGDGIYIAGSKRNTYSQDIIVEGVRSINNRRQGLSIISAKNVQVSNCVFSDTRGTLPGAGLDIEPNNPEDIIQNIKIENCVFKNNFGAGIVVGLGKLKASSSPVQISFENCLLKRNHSLDNNRVASEIIIGANKKSPVAGSVLFKNLQVEDSNWGLLYTRKRADAFHVQFKDCSIKNISKKGEYPIVYFEVPDYYNKTGYLGGFSFDNLYIENEVIVDFLFVRGSRLGTLEGVKDVHGSIFAKGLNDKPLHYVNYSPILNRNLDINFTKVE